MKKNKTFLLLTSLKAYGKPSTPPPIKDIKIFAIILKMPFSLERRSESKDIIVVDVVILKKQRRGSLTSALDFPPCFTRGGQAFTD